MCEGGWHPPQWTMFLSIDGAKVNKFNLTCKFFSRKMYKTYKKARNLLITRQIKN